MSEMNTHEPADPMEVWEQWYETVSKGWLSTLNGSRHENGSKPALPDPFSLYQNWLQSIANVQEQFLSSSGDPQELWRRWSEALTDIWRQGGEAGSDPLGLTAQWLEMMEEVRAKLLAGIKLPTDPFTFFKQWYEATNETWSTLIGNLIGTEKFMEVSSEFLKSYASFYGTLRRTNEEYFRNLQLPTRPDVARVAELVVNLEEKVDRIDSMLEDAEDRSAQLATRDSVASVYGRVEDLGKRLEDKSAQLATRDSVASVYGRVEDLEKRLDRVEGKLDSVLAALEKLATREYPEPAKPAETPRRTTRKSATQARKTGGTETQTEAEQPSR